MTNAEPKKTPKMLAAWWWIDRWRKSTAYTDMTLEQQGAYRNLIDELWLREGVLPDDERVLARASGDPVAWPSMRDVVMSRFYRAIDGWRNETHDEVFSQTKIYQSLAEQRKEAGREGGRRSAALRAKSKQSNQTGNQNVKQSVKQTVNTPSPSPSLTDSTAIAVVVPHPSWNQEAIKDYQDSTGGVVSNAMAARITKALKPLVEKVVSNRERENGGPTPENTFQNSWMSVRIFWKAFCESEAVKYGPESFTNNPRQVMPRETKLEEARRRSSKEFLGDD